MSIKMMCWVWESSKSKSITRLVLLALADHANDDGDCWPGVKRLASKANCSASRARQALRELEALGEIITTDRYRAPDGTTTTTERKGSRQTSNNYRFTLKTGPEDTPRQHAVAPPDNMLSPPPDNMLSPNPHVDPPYEPSFLPAQENAQAKSLDELEYTPIEDEDDGFGSSKKKPKWQIPETPFQDWILGVCKRRWFRPGEKTRVKALEKAVQIAESLDDGGSARCLEILEAYTGEGLPALLPPIPRSWIDWRAEHARRHRWSFAGFLDALHDRDALVTHCRIQLRKAGVPVIPELPVNKQDHDWTPEEMAASLERLRKEREDKGLVPEADASTVDVSSAAEPSAVSSTPWSKSEERSWARFTGGRL